MTEKHGKTLNHEIRKRETSDLHRRDIKNPENDDKLEDFMKIKTIKTMKIAKLVENKRKEPVQAAEPEDNFDKYNLFTSTDKPAVIDPDSMTQLNGLDGSK